MPDSMPEAVPGAEILSLAQDFPPVAYGGVGSRHRPISRARTTTRSWYGEPRKGSP
jgi:hypothetical protein